MSIQLGGPKKPQNLEKAKVILCLFLLAFSNIATFSQTLSRAPSQGRGESFYYRMTQLLPTIDMGHNLFDVMTKAGYQNVVVDVGPTNEAVTMSQVDRHMNTLIGVQNFKDILIGQGLSEGVDFTEYKANEDGVSWKDSEGRLFRIHVSRTPTDLGIRNPGEAVTFARSQNLIAGTDEVFIARPVSHLGEENSLPNFNETNAKTHMAIMIPAREIGAGSNPIEIIRQHNPEFADKLTADDSNPQLLRIAGSEATVRILPAQHELSPVAEMQFFDTNHVLPSVRDHIEQNHQDRDSEQLKALRTQVRRLMNEVKMATDPETRQELFNEYDKNIQFLLQVADERLSHAESVANKGWILKNWLLSFYYTLKRTQQFLRYRKWVGRAPQLGMESKYNLSAPKREAAAVLGVGTLAAFLLKKVPVLADASIGGIGLGSMAAVKGIMMVAERRRRALNQQLQGNREFARQLLSHHRTILGGDPNLMQSQLRLHTALNANPGVASHFIVEERPCVFCFNGGLETHLRETRPFGFLTEDEMAKLVMNPHEIIEIRNVAGRHGGDIATAMLASRIRDQKLTPYFLLLEEFKRLHLGEIGDMAPERIGSEAYRRLQAVRGFVENEIDFEKYPKSIKPIFSQATGMTYMVGSIARQSPEHLSTSVFWTTLINHLINGGPYENLNLKKPEDLAKVYLLLEAAKNSIADSPPEVLEALGGVKITYTEKINPQSGDAEAREHVIGEFRLQDGQLSFQYAEEGEIGYDIQNFGRRKFSKEAGIRRQRVRRFAENEVTAFTKMRGDVLGYQNAVLNQVWNIDRPETRLAENSLPQEKAHHPAGMVEQLAPGRRPVQNAGFYNDLVDRIEKTHAFLAREEDYWATTRELENPHIHELGPQSKAAVQSFDRIWNYLQHDLMERHLDELRALQVEWLTGDLAGEHGDKQLTRDYGTSFRAEEEIRAEYDRLVTRIEDTQDKIATLRSLYSGQSTEKLAWLKDVLDRHEGDNVGVRRVLDNHFTGAAEHRLRSFSSASRSSYYLYCAKRKMGIGKPSLN